MTPQDAELLIDKLTTLAEYYEKPKSEAQISIYVQALSDLPLTDTLNALNALVKTSTFYPKVSEIRAMVEGGSDDQSEAAWAKLLQQIRREGYTGKPELSEAIWEVVRELWGSWVHLCQTLPADGPELLGWAKRFKSVYGSAQRVSARMSLPLFPSRAELSE